jgi:glycine cleavage system H protein
VLEINKALNSTPETVNQDPYGAGWMIKIEITNAAGLNDLLDSAAYAELIGQ